VLNRLLLYKMLWFLSSQSQVVRYRASNRVQVQQAARLSSVPATCQELRTRNSAQSTQLNNSRAKRIGEDTHALKSQNNRLAKTTGVILSGGGVLAMDSRRKTPR